MWANKFVPPFRFKNKFGMDSGAAILITIAVGSLVRERMNSPLQLRMNLVWFPGAAILIAGV